MSSKGDNKLEEGHWLWPTFSRPSTVVYQPNIFYCCFRQTSE